MTGTTDRTGAPRRVLVLNPNSSQPVTDAIGRALAPLATAIGAEAICETLPEGPPGIETEAHVASVVEPGARRLAAREGDADAFVIACFSDPGLDLARSLLGKPVFGIAESAFIAATLRGERFGVIAIRPQSIPRHLRYLRRLGLDSRLAGDRAIDLGVVELSDAERTFERMHRVGRELVTRDGAEVLIMGCAGMAAYRDGLEAELGVPVLDPSQVAFAMAASMSALPGWSGLPARTPKPVEMHA